MFFYKAFGHSVERKFHCEHLLPAILEAYYHTINPVAAAAAASSAAAAAA
jgi:hypothetical protein